jgi:hypothetical protein
MNDILFDPRAVERHAASAAVPVVAHQLEHYDGTVSCWACGRTWDAPGTCRATRTGQRGDHDGRECSHFDQPEMTGCDRRMLTAEAAAELDAEASR